MNKKDLVYKNIKNFKNDDEIFDYLIDTLKDTIISFDYFVKWEKVIKNTKEVEIKLNILNYLLGKDDIKNETKNLIKKYPEVIEVFPILIASREKNFKILKKNNNSIDKIEFNFDMKNKTEKDIDNIVDFLYETNLLSIFKDKKIKNLVDYVFGIEVGLDTNARKNRTGECMENMVEFFVKNICTKYNLEYKTQITSPKIKEIWNIDVPTDKNNRIFDFVINNNGKLLIIECNYFNSTGSKLKAVCSEFSLLDEYMKNSDITFLWITDGFGWHSSKNSLKEAFCKMRYIFNLNMLECNLLEELIKDL